MVYGGIRNSISLVLYLIVIAPWQDGDVTVEASQQEKQLYNLLLQGYSKQTRPVRKVGDPVRVKVALSLVEVLGIDENNGQISVKTWLTMNWKDEYLIWNPDLHGGVRRLNFATGAGGRIWTPDILVFNSLKSEFESNAQAVVYSDGSVTWVQPAVYTVRCRHEFRGNSWVAGFKLGSWTYDERLLDLRPLPVGGKSSVKNADDNSDEQVVDLDVDSYSTNDHWAMLDHTGRRESKTATCCVNALLANGEDTETPPSPSYVSLHYMLKLRKKLGPSLLGRRRRR